MRAIARWIVLTALLVGACSGASPSASHVWPPIPTPPTGWTSVGGFGGDQDSGIVVAVYLFEQHASALDAACAGDGTLAVILGWPDAPSISNATVSSTALFPCGGDLANPTMSRVELTSGPSGPSAVSAFMVPSANSTVKASFGVSLEQREP